MAVKVVIAHAEGEESLAESLAGPLREAGYDVAHRGTVLVGQSVTADCHAALNAGAPVVVCATVEAMGTAWAQHVVNAAQGYRNVRVFPVRMEQKAYVESLLPGVAVAEYWRNPHLAIHELLATLSKHYPLDAAGRPSEPGANEPSPPSAPSIRWDDELRVYGESVFAGRKAELRLLDRALAAKKVRVLSLWAEGGAGKTRLLFQWLNRVRDDGWRGLNTVFVHSFYSQGSGDDRGGSSDNFFDDALEFFGYEGEPIIDAREKGRQLADLVVSRNALLVLDGLEPLQHPPHDARKGELKDPAVAALLAAMATAQAGLCLVTTRQKLPELENRRGKAVKQQELNRLNAADGVYLLRELGVNGPDDELRQAVEDYRGHAYSLMLLGTYLKEATDDHDIGQRPSFPLLAQSEAHDNHAAHVLKTYERHLGDDSPELSILRLLGFFDRPATGELIDVLRAPEAGDLETVTRPLLDLSRADWNRVLHRLQDLHLLDVGEDGSLDSHPLLREYFAGQLRGRFDEAFRAGHRRLYEHLTAATEHQPDTLTGLQPLYQAVRHGCLAGMHQQACEAVYRDRILRGTGSAGFYSTQKLGAFGADLGAVACFFDEPWGRVSPNLSEPEQAWLLNAAAFRLRALGRGIDALEPMRAGLEMDVHGKDWTNAAISASNLSQLELTLGRVADTVDTGAQSVDFADRSGDAFQRMGKRTTHADSLHQAGRRSEARALFEQAEAMQAADQPAYPRLYSLQGFRYCDLLLSDAEVACGLAALGNPPDEGAGAALEDVNDRAGEALQVAERNKWLLDIGHDHLTLARVALYRLLLTGEGDAQDCIRSADQAVNGLRASGEMGDLPRGLLTRAWARHVAGYLDGCRTDLDEAWGIAERGEMKLHMADVELYRARLFRDRAARDRAADLIAETGYHRRDQELADLGDLD